MKKTDTLTSVKIFSLLFSILLMGSLLLGGCLLSMQSFTAPDTADTGTVITLSFAGQAVDNGDDASEYGLVLQLPDNWTVLSAKASVSDAPITLSLTEKPGYESLYTAEAGCKVWVGTSTNSGEGDRSVTVTAKVLVGEFSGSIGEVRSFSLKTVPGAFRNGAWMTDDPAGAFDFAAITGEPYVEEIEVTKEDSDTTAPDAITTLVIKDLCDGRVELSWAGYDEAGQGDVVQYNIYQDTVSFTDVSAMIPISMTQCGTFSVSISLSYGAEYFFAVTAVDELGNENTEVTCQNFVLPGQCQGDFDHDQDVDGADLAVFAAEFGRTDCPCESSGGLMMSSAASTEGLDFQEIQNLQDEIIGLRAELAAKEKRLEELVSSAAR